MVVRFHSLTGAVVVLLAVALSCWTGAARADFSIIPISVSLTPQKSTDLVTLHNGGTKELRLQLSVYKWDQTPEGKLVLTPTDDVVFYPPIVTVAAKEDRIIRVGTAIPFGFTEQAYRVVAQELPPPAQPPKPGETTVQTKVIVLTKMSIPVFLEPPSFTHADSLAAPVIQNGRLAFKVNNDGNVRVQVGQAIVDGFGNGNKPLFHRKTMRGAYVLAGEHQEYELEVPNPPCGEIQKLSIAVPVTKPFGQYDVKGDTLKAELNVTPDKCGTRVAASAKTH